MPPLEPGSFSRRRSRVATGAAKAGGRAGGRLCPTLYPSRPPAGRMISHLFRRLISSQPFRYSRRRQPPSASAPPLAPTSFRNPSETLRERVTIKGHSPHRVCLLTEALIKCRREFWRRRMGSRALSSRSLRGPPTLLPVPPLFVNSHPLSLSLGSSFSGSPTKWAQ